MSSSTNNASTSSSDEKGQQRWFPLESNPALMNSYVQKLGFDTSLYEFTDVFSTEPWALQMIPQPVAAVLMLYPLTDVQESHRKEESVRPFDETWFIRQRIGNACGTIGLLHALLNVPEGVSEVSVQPKSWLQNFSQDCPKSLDPTAKAERLEQDSAIATLHDQATSDETLNQTSRGNLQDKVITHFVALVCVNNGLYELDGRKEGPVGHGDTTPETLLQDACKVVETFMKRDPTEMRFTILALAPKVE